MQDKALLLGATPGTQIGVSQLLRLPASLQLGAVNFLHMHVMESVRHRIEAGQKHFVDEMRVCTLLFMGFPSLKAKALVFSKHHSSCLQMSKAHLVRTEW